jgi:hypothetical protein
MGKWIVVPADEPDPDAALYDRLFDVLARADRMSCNLCPCGCGAMLGECAAADRGELPEALTDSASDLRRGEIEDMDERIDDCSGCEGQDALDERNLCPTCAHEVDHDPWHVVEVLSGKVAHPGPYSQDNAKHVERVYNGYHFRHDAGSKFPLVRAQRVGRAS